ncbi:MAG: hypothetical protein JWL86_3181 [Rhizobium sp.]|nr:hypothetical protein [Rhizobium sp.]
MATKPRIMPKGRQTIRNPHAPRFVDHLGDTRPADQRDNPRTRLWDFEVKPGTTMAKLEAAYLGAFDAVDNLGAFKSASIKSGKLTDQGVTDAALNFTLNSAVPIFKRGRDIIKAAKAEAQALREKVKLAPPDKTDVVSANLRAEMRAYLRGLKTEERNAYLAENADRISPEMALAIIEAPSVLSGVLEVDRAKLIDKALTAQHGETVEQIQELERAIEVAQSVVEAGREAVRLDAGVMDPHKFDQLAAPVENKLAAPYLKKFNENGVEKVRKFVRDPSGDSAKWTEATAADLETGIYYENYDQYEKENYGAAHQNQSTAVEQNFTRFVNNFR